jgi:hypothetical protein
MIGGHAVLLFPAERGLYISLNAMRQARYKEMFISLSPEQT